MTSMAGLIGGAVAFALPPRCAGCGTVVLSDLALCDDCWRSLDFLTEPGCALCAGPIPAAHAICAPCLQKQPVHDGAFAAVAYDNISRSIALKLKHGRRTGLAKLMAQHMTRRLPEDAELLVPVPLHPRRLWSRGFNQSVLIGRHVSKSSGIPMLLDGLRRTKATPMLGELGAQDRARTVAGAFQIEAQAKALLAGKNVVLIDDVYTSGATGNACARVLKRSGAVKVTLLCWARVILSEAGD